MANETKTSAGERTGGHDSEIGGQGAITEIRRVVSRWPDRGLRSGLPGDLARLLHDVTRYIRRYVVVSDPQALAITLWVAHCHAFAAAEATPYVNVTSAVKQSGKTRLLEVLEPIVPAAWLTGRVSAAVLTRKVDAETPTLLLDESDAAFKRVL